MDIREDIIRLFASHPSPLSTCEVIRALSPRHAAKQIHDALRRMLEASVLELAAPCHHRLLMPGRKMP